MTQPVLRNRSNRQGGGGFHASPLLVNSTPFPSLGPAMPVGHHCLLSWVLCSLLAPLLLGHWRLQCQNPNEFPEFPVNPTLFSKASFFPRMTLNTGGDCSRIAWATMSCRVLAKQPLLLSGLLQESDMMSPVLELDQGVSVSEKCCSQSCCPRSKDRFCLLM